MADPNLSALGDARIKLNSILWRLVANLEQRQEMIPHYTAILERELPDALEQLISAKIDVVLRSRGGGQ